MKKNRAYGSYKKDSEVNILKPLERLYDWKYFSLAFSLLFMAVMLYFALTLHKVGDFDVETDFYGGYAPEAKNFMMGKIVIDSYHGPLYPWLLGLFGKLIGSLFTTGVVMAVVSASLSLYFVFEIIKSISSPDVAFLATVLTVVNTFFIWYSYSAGTDMFFVMLSLAGIFLLFRKSEISLFELCLAAVAFALAYLVRYNGLIFLIAIPFVVLFGAIQVKSGSSNGSIRNKYVVAAIWALVFLVVIAPWSVCLKMNRGSFFYNANYQNMAFELFGGGYANWDQFWYKQASRYTSYWAVLSADPILFVQTVLGNVYSHFIGDITELNNEFIGVLSALGAVLFAFSHPTRRKIGLVAIFVSFFCVLLTVFQTERLSLPLLPIYSFFASYLLKRVMEKLRSKKSAVILVNLLAAAVVIMTFANSYVFNSKNISPVTNGIVETSEWFNRKFDHKYDNQQIAARKPHIAYFLNMRLYPFPIVDNYDSLITLLRRDSVEFLFYGTFEASDRPQFTSFLGKDKEQPGLEPLCVTMGPKGGVMSVLYEVTK